MFMLLLLLFEVAMTMAMVRMEAVWTVGFVD